MQNFYPFFMFFSTVKEEAKKRWIFSWLPDKKIPRLFDQGFLL
jgi:hypothetical protein